MISYFLLSVKKIKHNESAEKLLFVHRLTDSQADTISESAKQIKMLTVSGVRGGHCVLMIHQAELKSHSLYNVFLTLRP